ncbi:MAG: ABC-F family ATP-binding cassette domain-containing protein [Bacteroidetes bacterium]|nr:ABC transporter ATP-binding protein [Bacteroidota bacterium]MBV6461546.1 ABC transporter ATP-binding protein uup [Flavobacteriales bacterium]WKZ76460.1 MAG: ABC-F family ATP-binding cassette domain-containing protein [Vicingaceae bacterium]MCL4815714.1 ATP-binding cassette domain-containing protein [Flavobacteriales bacterium]NOG94145.1 ABC-F family ATP-binding cassette domain-containing protein [Bacteroidota bacterium]
MNLLSVENLSKEYGEKPLFDKISFGIEQGQRVALVARNGAGKTTLLNILNKKDIADEGNVIFRNDIRVSFLEQEPRFDMNLTVYDALFFSENEHQKAVKAYEIALETNDSKKIEEAMLLMDSLNAWDYEAKVKQILFKLKISWLNQKINSLSGGQLKRLALARVLIEEPQLLIMDEPTNHLDLEMIEWLENYFTRNDITLLVVTHDRYFLDNVCTDILELENRKLYRYKGNFEYFIEKKAEREFNEIQELDKAKNLYRRELEWVRKMPKARGTKSKSRVDAFHQLEDKIAGKRKTEELKLNVKMSRIGGKILELKKVYKSFDNISILKGFDYTFRTGERIGIVGKNGIGKSTLLNIIAGLENADSGKINLGETIVLGYYSQKGLQLKEDKRVIEVVKDIAEIIPLSDGSKLSASQFLQLFQFPPEMQYTFVSKLSGGEKKRLYLLTVLIKNPNFLLLDEPTNDLDLLTLSTLEDFLISFKGCLLIVSHDRYFMDKLVDQLFVFEGNGVVSGFSGNYSEYREKLKIEVKEVKDEKINRKDYEKLEVVNSKKEKLSYKEKFELESLEKEIQHLEERKKQLLEALQNSLIHHEQLAKYTEELADVNTLIDDKSFRWLELSERA